MCALIWYFKALTIVLVAFVVFVQLQGRVCGVCPSPVFYFVVRYVLS